MKELISDVCMVLSDALNRGLNIERINAKLDAMGEEVIDRVNDIFNTIKNETIVGDENHTSFGGTLIKDSDKLHEVYMTLDDDSKKAVVDRLLDTPDLDELLCEQELRPMFITVFEDMISKGILTHRTGSEILGGVEFMLEITSKEINIESRVLTSLINSEIMKNDSNNEYRSILLYKLGIWSDISPDGKTLTITPRVPNSIYYTIFSLETGKVLKNELGLNENATAFIEELLQLEDAVVDRLHLSSLVIRSLNTKTFDLLESEPILLQGMIDAYLNIYKDLNEADKSKFLDRIYSDGIIPIGNNNGMDVKTKTIAKYI